MKSFPESFQYFFRCTEARVTQSRDKDRLAEKECPGLKHLLSGW